jgi:hypothetical protein
MRTILVGTLAATLVGCSCPLPPQTVMKACTDANGFACFDREVASQPIEPKPESFKAKSATIKAKTTIAAKTEKLSSDDDRDRPHLATKKAKSTMAASKVEPTASGQAAEPSGPVTTIVKTAIAVRTEKPSSDDERDRPHLAMEKAKSTIAAVKVEPPASGQPAEPSDPVITRAKTAIAAKLEVPASAEFGEMKRAFRKNTLGQSVDTICGRVKGKKASGEDTGDRPFLYLVKEDDAYVVDGPPGSAGATAYRNICN